MRIRQERDVFFLQLDKYGDFVEYFSPPPLFLTNSEYNFKLLQNCYICLLVLLHFLWFVPWNIAFLLWNPYLDQVLSEIRIKGICLYTTCLWWSQLEVFSSPLKNRKNKKQNLEVWRREVRRKREWERRERERSYLWWESETGIK